MIPIDVGVAFHDGYTTTDEEGDHLSIHRQDLGILMLTSGTIVACDPYALGPNLAALTTSVPRGRSPVVASVVR